MFAANVSIRVKSLLNRGRSFLSRKGWLSHTDPDFAASLLRKAVLIKSMKGDTIWQAGEEGGGLLGIFEGDASLVSSLGAACAPLIHIARPGFWTGEGTVITGEPRRLSLIARTPVLALNVPLFEIRQLLENKPSWWQEVARLSLDLQQIATVGAADLILPSNQIRIAAVLLRVCGFRHNNENGMPVLQISHEELGQMAGIGRQATARSIKLLEDSGNIRTRYGAIELLYPEKLRIMVNEC